MFKDFMINLMNSGFSVNLVLNGELVDLVDVKIINVFEDSLLVYKESSGFTALVPFDTIKYICYFSNVGKSEVNNQ